MVQLRAQPAALCASQSCGFLGQAAGSTPGSSRRQHTRQTVALQQALALMQAVFQCLKLQLKPLQACSARLQQQLVLLGRLHSPAPLLQQPVLQDNW
jgi:hypothetical protein